MKIVVVNYTKANVALKCIHTTVPHIGNASIEFGINKSISTKNKKEKKMKAVDFV